MNSNNELQEVLLQAMEIIANKAIEDNNKDKDITLWTCTITDDSNRKSGEYKVTDDNVTFYAYSAYTDYKKDDHVAVVIPKGDFNNTKYIVQKVAADGTQLPYASPLSNYIEMTDDLIGDFGVRNYTVNDNGKEYEIARIDLNNAYSATTTQGASLYNALIFKCVFQTNLSSYKGVKGNYGIKIILDYLNELGYPLQETLTFDSSEFLGNIYNFMVPSIQTKGFALTKSEVLQRITVRYYQNLEMPQSKKAKTASNFTPPLIELEDLHIYFGSDISKVENQTLELYSLDGLTYYGDKTQADNEKRIGLMWYNKNEEGFKGFADGIYDVEYDEEAYLGVKQKKAAQDIEFKKENAPKTASGVAAAAYLTSFEEDTKTILTSIDKIISIASDMNIEMHGIFGKISDAVKERVEKISNKVKSDEVGYLANLHKEFEEDVKGFISKYRTALTTTEDIQKVDAFPFGELDKLDSILSADKSFEYLLGKNVLDTIKANHGGYFGVFESYDSRIKKIRVSINGLRTKIASAQDQFETAFVKRNTDTEEYKPFDETGYENRYCVYWYEYEQGYESPNEYDKQIAGSNWKKLSEQNGFWNPGVGKSVSGVTYNQEFKKDTFTYSIAPAAKDKKLMAVLFYNHNQYKSKPLSFSRIASDGTVIDDNGVFEIQHGDGSMAVYSNYGEDSYLINSSDARKERILVPQFISTLGKTLKDFIGGQIYWYLPQSISMLKYDENNKLIQTYAISKDLDSMDPKHYRQGYYCFTKSIQNAVDESGNEIPITNRDLGFSYLINNCYSSTYTNNTIYCKIVKGSWEYETYMPFSFSSYGTNGTDYTLAFQIPPGGRSAITEKDPVVLYIKLFDYNKKEAPLYVSNPTDTTTIPETLYGYGVTATFLRGVSSNPVCTLEQESTYIKATIDKASNKVPSYGILRVEAIVRDKAQGIDGLKLVNFYSVPYSNPIGTDSKDFIEGATQIIYSSFGNDPKYYKDPYKLYSGVDMQEQTDVKWTILSGTQNDGFPKTDKTNKLIVRDSFTEDAKGTIPVAIATQSNTVRWYQPILVQQNQYEFKLLNDWNGKMQISEEEGYILSNMLVAGKKANGKFTGVVMGDMGTLNKFETGLFGIHEGISSFGFKTDGTAYLGKSGSGRIEFNGDKGTITSEGYDDGKGTGILIDLDDPKFHIIKTVDGVTKDLLSLNYKDPNNIFFLRSFDFEDTNDSKKGFELDIQGGKLKAYNGLSIVTSDFNLISTKDNFAIKISSDDFILKADTDYYISKNENSAYGVVAGIKWGDYFHVTADSFHIGKEDGTNIWGKDEAITFNFDNGSFLKFSSDCFEVKGTDNGVTKATINIQSGSQVLESTNFTEPNGTYPLGRGTSINLITGEVKAYSGFKLKTSEFQLESTTGEFALIMKPDSFLLKADNTHFIDKDLSKGIEWGTVFHVNSTDFHLGNRELDETVTPAKYKSSFIYGNSQGISFNFTNGSYLKFGSDGFTTMDGDKVTMNIVQGQQLLQGSNYNPPTYNEDGSLKEAGTGMLIDLHKGEIKAYSGLTIVTNDFDLGTDTGNSYIKLQPNYFRAQANENNYLQISSAGVEIKTNNFIAGDSSSGNYISVVNGVATLKSSLFSLIGGIGSRIRIGNPSLSQIIPEYNDQGEQIGTVEVTKDHSIEITVDTENSLSLSFGDLGKMNSTNFYLQSWDYNTKNANENMLGCKIRLGGSGTKGIFAYSNFVLKSHGEDSLSRHNDNVWYAIGQPFGPLGKKSYINIKDNFVVKDNGIVCFSPQSDGLVFEVSPKNTAITTGGSFYSCFGSELSGGSETNYFKLNGQPFLISQGVATSTITGYYELDRNGNVGKYKPVIIQDVSTIRGISTASLITFNSPVKFTQGIQDIDTISLNNIEAIDPANGVNIFLDDSSALSIVSFQAPVWSLKNNGRKNELKTQTLRGCLWSDTNANQNFGQIFIGNNELYYVYNNEYYGIIEYLTKAFTGDNRPPWAE